MKKIIFLIIFFICFPLFAEMTEPDNFRGHKFGADFSEFKNTYNLIIDKNVKSCSLKNDKLKIGNADLLKIYYHFYKDSLYVVYIKAMGYSNFKILKRVYFENYGKGKQDNELIHEYIWDFTKTRIYIKYSGQSEETIIVYYYFPIYNEKINDEKEAAKKAKKDL